MTHQPNTYSDRIKLLEEFLSAAKEWSLNTLSQKKQETLRTFLNRNLLAVKTAVTDAGILKTMTLMPPPSVGGPVQRNVNPFDNLFDDWYGVSFISMTLDMVEQAIGVYEHLKDNTGLVHLTPRQTIDIVSFP